MAETHLFEQSVQSQYLDEHGREKPNPVPLEPPLGYIRHKSIAEQIREQVLAVSREAAESGLETEQEANDFDVDEDYEPTSPWEHDFEVDPALETMIALQSKPPQAEPAQPAPTTTPATVIRSTTGTG